VAVDAAGNLFIADPFNRRIRRVEGASGVITTVAGTGTEGFSGDGGLATDAQIDGPDGVAVDASGNLFIADANNSRIRRVDAATGVITTVAGTGTEGFSGDGGPATSASLSGPTGVAVDASGNLFIADFFDNRIRRVDTATGVITTVAGTGASGFSGDGGPATSASLSWPTGVAVDTSGNLFIADHRNHRIRMVDAATSVITTVAGAGPTGFGAGSFSGDGGPATDAQLAEPLDVAVDAAGNLFIADWRSHRVRRVKAATGVTTTVAGGGVGDGGPAISASLRSPSGVAVDALGNLFIADGGNNRIGRVDDATWVIATVAGGTSGFSGDGGPATSASLNVPSGVALDASGNLFIADRDNNRIRRVDGVTGVITTVAGSGATGLAAGSFSGDGGPATSASLNSPRGVAVDALGNLYIADGRNNRIRRVDGASGIITTVAGNGTSGFFGDGGPGTSASLSGPTGVTVDASGNLFIADTRNNRIRRVDGATGVITTVAGDGASGFSGDGGPATSASLNRPGAVAVDASGNLLIADARNHRIRRGDAATGVITTVAGSGPTGFGGGSFSGDGGPATGAGLNFPFGVAVDASGNMFIADTLNHRVRKAEAVAALPADTAGGGACSSTFGRTPPLTGLANILLLIAPLGLVAAMRRRHRLCDGPPCRIHDQAM
jgi:sugar lactone lactonase YvrE